MRKLTINRERKFNSCLMPVWVFIDINPYECLIDNNDEIMLDVSKIAMTVKNGKTKKIEINGDEHSIYLAWIISTDNLLHVSERFVIQEGKDNIKLKIKNHYSFTKGSSFEILKER